MVLETLAVNNGCASVTAVATSFVFIVQEVLQMSPIVPPSANRLHGTGPPDFCCEHLLRRKSGALLPSGRATP
jgi:hypothetical protein